MNSQKKTSRVRTEGAEAQELFLWIWGMSPSVCGCVHQPGSSQKLSRPHGMFMEALSHRHIQLLTAFQTLSLCADGWVEWGWNSKLPIVAWSF